MLSVSADHEQFRVIIYIAIIVCDN